MFLSRAEGRYLRLCSSVSADNKESVGDRPERAAAGAEDVGSTE